MSLLSVFAEYSGDINHCSFFNVYKLAFPMRAVRHYSIKAPSQRFCCAIPTVSFSSSPTTSIYLTTIFTSSSSCLNEYYLGNIITLGPSSKSDCLPSGWNSLPQHFSPGRCPSGHDTACSTLASIGSLTEMQATCCPSGYSCQTENIPTWLTTWGLHEKLPGLPEPINNSHNDN